MSKFTDLLDNPTAIKRFLVEAEPYDPAQSQTVTLRYSDHGFTTEPNDSPANTFYEPRISQGGGFTFERSLSSLGRIRGDVDVDAGTLTILSGEIGSVGDIDNVANYAWDARAVRIKLGGDDFAFSEYGLIFDGTAEAVDLTDEAVEIRLRSGIFQLDIPIQENAFAGTGGIEGPSSLTDQLKPLCYGRARWVEPVFIGNVDFGDGALLTYMVHDPDKEDIEDVDEAFSNANDLTKVTNQAPSAGEYRVWPTKGSFQLGGSDAQTLITCHVKGAKPGGTYIDTTADIIEHLITDRTSLTMEANTVSDLNSKNNNTVGIFLGDGGNLLDTLGTIARSIGATLFPTRKGEIRLARIEAPKSAGNEDAAYNETEILALERSATVIPPKAVRLRYNPINRRHRSREIAGVVGDDRRALVQQDWKTVKKTDSSVATKHKRAREETFESLLDGDAPADTEAQRLIDLFGETREVFEVELSTPPFGRELGETVKITTDQTGRYNLSNGKTFIIIGLQEEAAFNRVTMTLWG